MFFWSTSLRTKVILSITIALVMTSCFAQEIPHIANYLEDFTTWRKLFLDAAATVASGLPNGLLGEIYTAAQYLAVFGAEYISLTVMNLRDKPVLGVNPGGAVVRALQIWNSDWNVFMNFLSSIQKFRLDFLLKLTPDLQAIVQINGEALHTLSIRTMLQRLDTRFPSDATALDKKVAKLSTLTIKLGDDINVHLAEFRKVHAYTVQCGQPIPEHQYVALLKASLQACQGLDFNPVFTQFTFRHPLIADHTFNNLASLAETYVRSMQDATVGGHGYANRAAQVPLRDEAKIGEEEAPPSRCFTRPLTGILAFTWQPRWVLKQQRQHLASWEKFVAILLPCSLSADITWLIISTIGFNWAETFPTRPEFLA